MTNFRIFFFLIATITSSVSNASAQPSSSINDYSIITEIYPPFNYEDDGKLSGISTEILVEILKEMKSDLALKDIHVFPWSRAYANLQKNPNTMVFSMTRTEERENLFKWVGPIAKIKVGLIAKKNRNIKINNAADIGKYKIGVVRSDIGELLVLAKGIDKKQLSAVTDLTQNIKKLITNRIDILAYEENSAFWTIKKLNEDVTDFESVYRLRESELYFAFNKNTPDELIKKFETAFTKIKLSKTYDQIIKKYLK